MTARCNIAFLSTAHIHTRDFLKNIADATDGRAVTAIWDDVPERGRRCAESSGARFEPDLDALLADPGIDGFIVCAENTRHLALLEKVLPVGKPVLCEKPLVVSPSDLKRVRELLARHPAPLFSGYFMPFSGEMRAVSRVLAEGRLGAVTDIRCRCAHFAAYGRWFDDPDLAWFTDPGLAGGGGFMDMGAHAIHLVRSLFGPVESVLAVIENRSGVYDKVDDGGTALLKMASGALCTIEAGWRRSGGILMGLEAVGTGKTLWKEGADYVTGTRKETPEAIAPIEPLPTRVDRLAAVIRGEFPREELQKDLEINLDSVAIMAACYESARTGAWVAADGVHTL
ncbi:MAG: Gfo/Idh/MocA family oxidoreductase [Terrimicrobiaceae bacterium]